MKKKTFTFIAGIIGSFISLILLTYTIYIFSKYLTDLINYDPIYKYGTPVDGIPSDYLQHLINTDYSHLYSGIIYSLLSSILCINNLIFNILQISKFIKSDVAYKKKQSTQIVSICLNATIFIFLISTVLSGNLIFHPLFDIIIIMLFLILIIISIIFYISELIIVRERLQQQELINELQLLKNKHSSKGLNEQDYFKQKCKLLERYILSK